MLKISFPKISLKIGNLDVDEVFFNSRKIGLSHFQAFPNYSREAVLSRLIQMGGYLNLPPWVYEDMGHVMYISSVLERQAIEEYTKRRLEKYQ